MGGLTFWIFIFHAVFSTALYAKSNDDAKKATLHRNCERISVLQNIDERLLRTALGKHFQAAAVYSQLHVPEISSYPSGAGNFEIRPRLKIVRIGLRYFLQEQLSGLLIYARGTNIVSQLPVAVKGSLREQTYKLDPEYQTKFFEKQPHGYKSYVLVQRLVNQVVRGLAYADTVQTVWKRLIFETEIGLQGYDLTKNMGQKGVLHGFFVKGPMRIDPHVEAGVHEVKMEITEKQGYLMAHIKLSNFLYDFRFIYPVSPLIFYTQDGTLIRNLFSTLILHIEERLRESMKQMIQEHPESETVPENIPPPSPAA